MGRGSQLMCLGPAAGHIAQPAPLRPFNFGSGVWLGTREEGRGRRAGYSCSTRPLLQRVVLPGGRDDGPHLYEPRAGSESAGARLYTPPCAVHTHPNFMCMRTCLCVWRARLGLAWGLCFQQQPTQRRLSSGEHLVQQVVQAPGGCEGRPVTRGACGWGGMWAGLGMWPCGTPVSVTPMWG